MIGKTLSHFRVVEKLGEGGMGVVYRAEDQKLGRQVALKVLHTEFVTDEERRKRFLREARTAAALSHPNIATIHEVGEEDGVIFIAMELVEGRTLGTILADQRPSVDECLRIAVEITDGLARAHQASIVHRDLKPENIILDADRRIKLLDFGLAKLYHDTHEPTSDESSGLQTVSAAVTREGRILGTVSYMSPEQARGLEVDARSDVFSLGIVIYEMITGQRPFQGQTVTDTLTAILRDEQAPIARFNPHVPVELERILSRCLSKDPDERYQSAAEMLVDLRKLKRMSDSQPVPLVTDPALVRSRRWPRLRPWRLAMGVGVLALAALAVPTIFRQLAQLGSIGSNRTLAVLPFDNLQQRADPDRLGQILQELIITDLSDSEELKVLSSQRLLDIQKQLGRDDPEMIGRDIAGDVARTAGAKLMLTGSLSQLGSTWILTSQLIDVADGSVLKSQRIDGTDLYEMVDDLTGRVRGDLSVAGETDVAVSERTTSSLPAYQEYLAGMDDLNALQWEDAAARFERAIDADPSFGRAYYKLAIARWWGRSFDAYELGSDVSPPGEVLQQLLTGGDVKLSRKDRLLADAFLALVEQRPADALPLFAELVELYPDDKEAWYGLGEARFHAAESDLEKRAESLEPFEKAADLDPSFSLAFYHVVDIYTQQKRFDEGIEKVRGFIARDPGDVSWHQDLARLVLAKGDPQQIRQVVDDALEQIDGRGDQRNLLYTVATAKGHKDRAELADELLQRALTINTDVLQDRILIALGETAAMQGRLDDAERYLLQVREADPRNVAVLKPLFQLYRKTSRFDDALRLARQITAETPGLEAPYGYWAQAAILAGNREESEAAIVAIDRLVGDSQDPLATLKLVGRLAVDAYLNAGDFTEADRLMAGFVESFPEVSEDGELQAGLGLVAQRLGRSATATQCFEKATKFEPGNYEAWFGMIRGFAEQGEAGRALKTAQELSERWGGPRGRLAEIYVDLETGRGDEARKIVDSIDSFENEEQHKYFLRELAGIYAGTGNFAEAEQVLRTAGAADAQDGEPLVELVEILLRLGKVDEAGDLLGRVQDDESRSPRLRRARIYHAMMAGDAAGAEKLTRAALDRGPVHSDLEALLALSLHEQGRSREAVERADSALRKNPSRYNHAVASWILIAGNVDVGRGIEVAQTGLQIAESPRDAWRVLRFVPPLEHCLGLAFLEQDRIDEAVEQLERAAKLRPDRPRIREDLAAANERAVARRS